MNIFIDESGSFVNAPAKRSWNAVAAFALPESARRQFEKVVVDLKRSSHQPISSEVKINIVDETIYLAFISSLARLNGSLFCIATEAGLNTLEGVVKHQEMQVVKILQHIGKMRHEGGRKGAALVASQVGNLSPQLYVQLLCQIELMHDVVDRAINYYAQHNPASLSEFRWRIDRKNAGKTDFEDAFEKLSPAFLQTISLSQPGFMVEGFDYSKMERYRFAAGEAPTYLKKDYGIDVDGKMLNIQKIIRGNIKFIDSKKSAGIQAVDLIVSGIRKCLRMGFQDNERVASLLGSLMLQAGHNEPPLRLLSFGHETALDPATAHLVHLMKLNAKPMLKRERRLSNS